MRKIKRSLSSAAGSGTVLVLGIVFACTALLGITQTVAMHMLESQRLQAKADSVAVAATDALRGLAFGFPCEVAQQMADRNMVKLAECRIVGFEVFISVQREVMGIVLIANARAGPSL
ncbi:MAG: hypothetical protein RLZZ229_115 [Actinomycetota bacterium]